MKKTVLLINLGTPGDCTPRAIKEYLMAFLNDERVIDLSFFIRWPLVNLGIIPFRWRYTRRAYQKIWTKEGSPLLTITKQQNELLAKHLGDNYHVEMAMRYGEPNLSEILKKIEQQSHITILPLFPQYASATTGSILEKILGHFSKLNNIATLSIINEFYSHPSFINAYAHLIKECLQNKKIDKIIFSYHAIPMRQLIKSKCHAGCDKVNICPDINEKNAFCYRAKCMATSKALAKALSIDPTKHETAFQSRLGKTPWIKPYIDILLPQLIHNGVKNIAIVCPSFVADCLETLEEINIRLRNQWLSLGGQTFILVPSLNTHPLWISAMADIVTT